MKCIVIIKLLIEYDQSLQSFLHGQIPYITLRVKLPPMQQTDNDFDIIIVECCEHCDTHQQFSRHSEWKYFEQFNELKKKIEKYVNNSIVIKNPIPDELIKTPEVKNQKTLFVNKNNNQKVTFPRIGAFQIYIYNLLIFSKLMGGSWPNHYKILQTLTKIIQEKNKGNNLEQFSVYGQSNHVAEVKGFSSNEIPSPQKKGHRIVSKKKKSISTQNQMNSTGENRIFRSIEKGDTIEDNPYQSKDYKNQTLEPLMKKQQKKDDKTKKRYQPTTSKLENRGKLPSLSQTVDMILKDESAKEPIARPKQFARIKKNMIHKDISSIDEEATIEKKNDKNTIQEIEKEEISFIERKLSDYTENNNYASMELKHDDSALRSNHSIEEEEFDKEDEELRMVENKSVQYSDRDYGKQFHSKAIQYSQENEPVCDFGLQIDDGSLPREVGYQFVQTEKIVITEDDEKPKNKVYMLDENTQANIEVKKPISEQDTQTVIKEYKEEPCNTDEVNQVNRGFQFPEEDNKSADSQVIDSRYQHLYEKRRNLIDSNSCYCIDRFEEKSTKYKWIGRVAHINQNSEDMKKKILLQTMLFSVYNYYGIKTPEKRLSYQQCANVVGDKMRESALHILTADNPQLQYLYQFEEYKIDDKKYPLSQTITFRTSKQSVKFKNYGGLLALAYFLNDYQLYSSHTQHLGVVIVNQSVKEIYKMSGLNYQIHPLYKNNQKDLIIVQQPSKEQQSNKYQQEDPSLQYIHIDRLSQEIELEFVAMMSRLTQEGTFEQMIHSVREIFVHNSTAYAQYKHTIESLKLEKIQQTVVEDFVKMLQNRVEKVKQLFKGKLYTYRKYHTLSPTIKYNLSLDCKIERKLKYKEKLITAADIGKHIRNKDNMVVIYGEEGLGKTTLLTDLQKMLKEVEKTNVLYIPNARSYAEKENKNSEHDLFQLSKNILLIDNGELYEQQIISLIQRFRKISYEISYCISTSNAKQLDILSNRFSNLMIVPCEMQAFDLDNIRTYMGKGVKNRNFTVKKDIIDGIKGQKQFHQVLSNPFYLSLYCDLLSDLNYSIPDPFQVKSQSDITKYMLIKQTINRLITIHTQEINEMSLPVQECYVTLRKMAFEYYHNGYNINEIIKNLIESYETASSSPPLGNNPQETALVRNQLSYYPINVSSVLPNNKFDALFTHREYLHFFIVQAYAYYVEKQFRNMKMDRLYNHPPLINLIKQKYSVDKSYHNLLSVVTSSKKYKNITEQSSNSLTLLNKMGYIFSNINFDECRFPDADLSSSIFYNCSFRGSDMNSITLYKGQVLSCVFDNTLMSNINLFAKKYEIEFTAMTTSLSVDGKKIAFGCGNFLIIINSQTGQEIKRLEAHLDVIRSVKYTKDGNSLISIADDKTLRIWDVYSYRSIVFKLPQKGSISYSCETETIASITKNALKVWNLKSMANEALSEGHSDAITCVEFSYNGEHILTGSKDTTIRMWNIRGKQVNIFKGHEAEIMVVKISPHNNRVILSSSKNKDLVMWETETENKLMQRKFNSEIIEICLDNRQKYVIITTAQDANITILDFFTLEPLHFLSGHQGRILSINYDSEFRRLITLGKDRSARIWELDRIMEAESKKIMDSQFNGKKFVAPKGPVLALSFDKVFNRYATSHQNGEICLFNSEDNSLIQALKSHDGPVRCLAFDRSGKIYSGGSDGTLRIWNLELRKEPRNLQIYSSQILQLKLSEKSRIIATSSASNQLVIHDFTGIKIVMSSRDEGRINAIEFSRDEKIMAVGGAQKYIVLYEIINGNTINRTEELGLHTDTINSLTFYGQNLLVCALKNGHVFIWNHFKASLVKKIQNVSSIRSILTFQKKFICFTSEDGKIRIVNMDEGREVKVFKFSDYSTCIDTNTDQSTLYVGTSQGNVLKWNLNCIKPAKKKIQFDRKAIDTDCTKEIIVEGARSLRIKDLFYHSEELVDVKVDSDIDGISFDGERVIMILKNGKYWEYGKKEYKMDDNTEFEGELRWIRDKNNTSFFKSGIKKVKGLNRPTLSIIQQANIQ